MVDFREDYCSRSAVLAIADELRRNGVVVLGDFLPSHSFAEVSASIAGPWTPSVIPDTHSFAYGAKRASSQGALRAYVQAIVGKNRSLHAAIGAGHPVRFIAGSYTLLHDDIAFSPGVHAFLFLDDWDASYGGAFHLVRRGSAGFSFVPRKNALLLVSIGRGDRYFFKYVNHLAKKRALRMLPV